jgi:hypothetical protein
MSRTTSDRVARLAELEFIALCKQHKAARRQAAGTKKPRRMKPDFYSHYLRPVQGLMTDTKRLCLTRISTEGSGSRARQ